MSESKDWVTIKIPKGTRDDARDDPRTYEEIMQAGLEGGDVSTSDGDLDEIHRKLDQILGAQEDTVSEALQVADLDLHELHKEVKKAQELAEQARDEAQQVKGQLR